VAYLAILVIGASSITAFTVFASAQEETIPSWIKTTVGFWIDGEVSDEGYLGTVQWLIENDIIKIDSDDELKEKVGKLNDEKQILEGDMQDLEKDISRLIMENQILQKEIDKMNDPSPYTGSSYEYDDYTAVEINPEDYCYGTAECFVGTVNKIIDGDTIEVDGLSIRFTLVNAPELNADGGLDAKKFVEDVCPVGSSVLVDEDDGQTKGSYGRTIAIVYCNDLNYNLNEAVIASGFAIIDTTYCSQSEFGSHYWPQILDAHITNLNKSNQDQHN